MYNMYFLYVYNTKIRALEIYLHLRMLKVRWTREKLLMKSWKEWVNERTITNNYGKKTSLFRSHNER